MKSFFKATLGAGLAIILVIALFYRGNRMADTSATSRSDTIYSQIHVAPDVPAEEFKNAGCLVKATKGGEDFFVLIDEGTGWSPAGGKPEVKADGVKEKTPETAGRETFEELFGDAIWTDKKMSKFAIEVKLERLIFGGGRFYMHACELNKPATRALFDLAGEDLTYNVGDGAVDADGTVKVQLFTAGTLPVDDKIYRFPDQGAPIREFAGQ